MIEVHQGLFVGDEFDEQQIRDQAEWFVIHACKEPYHRRLLGYSGGGAPKTHPEYLIARREGRLFLNLVDAPNVNFIPAAIIDAAVDAIRDNIGTSKVLVHCNQGHSRSPTIALLYLAKHTDQFQGLGIEDALRAFQILYPPYLPARGVTDYARINWSRYSPSA